MTDRRLETAMVATVRVNQGTGVVLAATTTHAAVILTAQHVVEGGNKATIRWQGSSRNEDVVKSDSELDIALVSAPRDLEASGLHLDSCEPGDEVWLLGYPGGWESAPPLVSRGNVAGLMPNTAWVDGSASWGHSGGPVVRLSDSGPFVIGTVIGAAGRVHRQLEEMIRIAGEEAALVEATIANRVTKGIPPESSLGLAGHATTRVSQAMELIRSHFRAGFVEIVLAKSAARLRGT